MERHCVRMVAIAERLAAGRPVDRDALLCGAWLHDAGLWTHSDDPYVTEGARLAQRTVEQFDWSIERVQLCMDACEQHHAPTSREDMGLEVELIRRADLIDVTGGAVAYGLPRSWVRGLHREVPADGLYGMLARAVSGELRRRPASFGRVFVSPPRTLATTGT